jgi:hypothetical protein
MIKFAVPTLLFFLLAPAASAQDANAIRCVATMYRLRGDNWKLIQAINVRPSLQEEELTNRRVRFDGRSYLFVSVFPTDESMSSAKGPDSLKIALAISSRRKANAFDLPNNAVAEATLATLDTLRVERSAYVAGRLRLMRFECWDSDLTKKT